MTKNKTAALICNSVVAVLTVSVRPDGGQVAVATLDGQITFFDVRTGIQVGSVEGRRDLAAGRRTSDKITAKTMATAKLVLRIL